MAFCDRECRATRTALSGRSPGCGRGSYGWEHPWSLRAPLALSCPSQRRFRDSTLVTECCADPVFRFVAIACPVLQNFTAGHEHTTAGQSRACAGLPIPVDHVTGRVQTPVAGDQISPRCQPPATSTEPSASRKAMWLARPLVMSAVESICSTGIKHLRLGKHGGIPTPASRPAHRSATFAVVSDRLVSMVPKGRQVLGGVEAFRVARPAKPARQRACYADCPPGQAGSADRILVRNPADLPAGTLPPPPAGIA